MGIFDKLFGKKNKEEKQKETIKKREGSKTLYDVPNENDRMKWGIEKANLTLNYFKSSLSNPKKGQNYFSIKAAIKDGKITEHIWLIQPSIDDQGNIFGIVGNEPMDVQTVKIDQKIGVANDAVSDWMIIENGRLIGGYTIRAIRDGLEENELENFDANLGGMIIDHGEDYFLPSFETPEGAILMLEEAYDNNDIDQAIKCKDFRKEAEVMLNSKFKEGTTDSLIKSTTELLELSFIKNLQENGMPSFKGIKRAFKRHVVSEDQCIITEICYYPDGGLSSQDLNVHQINNEWKVLGLVD